MDNAGSAWTQPEEQQLINEYNTQNMSVDEIADIHKRKAGGISARLVKLGVIKERKEARRSEKKENVKAICEKKEKIKAICEIKNENELVFIKRETLKELEEKIKVHGSKIKELEEKVINLQLYVKEMEEIIKQK